MRGKDKRTHIDNSYAAEEIPPCNNAILVEDGRELRVGLSGFVWVAEESDELWNL